MKQLLLTLILFTIVCGNVSAGLNPTKSWFNNENFEGFTLGQDFKTADPTNSYSGWNTSSTLYVLIQNSTNYNGSLASGQFLGFAINNTTAIGEVGTSGDRSFNKSFDPLEGYIYGKTSFYACTSGTTYSLRNSAGEVVFEFGGINNTAGAALWSNVITNSEIGLASRAKWSDIEFILDAAGSKLLKVIFTHNE